MTVGFNAFAEAVFPSLIEKRNLDNRTIPVSALVRNLSIATVVFTLIAESTRRAPKPLRMTAAASGYISTALFLNFFELYRGRKIEEEKTVQLFLNLEIPVSIETVAAFVTNPKLLERLIELTKNNPEILNRPIDCLPDEVSNLTDALVGCIPHQSLLPLLKAGGKISPEHFLIMLDQDLVFKEICERTKELCKEIKNNPNYFQHLLTDICRILLICRKRDIKILADLGFDIDRRDQRGYTPLMSFAIGYEVDSHIAIMKIEELLKYGANVDVRTADGKKISELYKEFYGSGFYPDVYDQLVALEKAKPLNMTVPANS